MTSRQNLEDDARSQRSRSLPGDKSPLTGPQQIMDDLEDQQEDRQAIVTRVRRIATPSSSRPAIGSKMDMTPRESKRLPHTLIGDLQGGFRQQDVQSQSINQRQGDMEGSANKLATSLTTALEQLGGSQQRHDAIMIMHAAAIQEMKSQTQLISQKSRQVETVTAAHSQLIESQLRDRQIIAGGIQRPFQEQSHRM